MKLRRTILIPLLIGCSLGGLNPVGGNETPQSLLQKAIVALESHRSVSVKTIRQRVDLTGRPLEGSGSYLEQRTDDGLFFRLELRFPIGDEPCLLQQICSGRYLWRYEKFRGAATLVRVDTARVARALDEHGELPQPGKIGDWPGLGGLPRLLRGLNAAFDFRWAEPAELRGGFAVTRLTGTWKTDRLIRMLPDQEKAIRAGEGANLERLPLRTPHYVVVHLGRDDFFPYCLEYRRKGVPAKAGAAPGEDKTILLVELLEVGFNVPISPETFHFDPGALEYSEQTDRFLEQLGLKK